MIERLAGRLLETGEGEVLIDVGGIGFRLQVPSGTASRLPAPGDEVRLTVRMLLHREETVQLYGFGSREEARFFDRLRGVNGVGPSVALNLLSLSVPRLRQAIRDKEVKFLQGAPGVGAKLGAAPHHGTRGNASRRRERRASAGATRSGPRTVGHRVHEPAVHRPAPHRGGRAVRPRRAARRRAAGSLQGGSQPAVFPRVRMTAPAPSPADTNEFWGRAQERLTEASGLLTRVRRISTARLAVVVVALALALGAGDVGFWSPVVGPCPGRPVCLAGLRARPPADPGARRPPRRPALPPGRDPGRSGHRGRGGQSGHASGCDPAGRDSRPPQHGRRGPPSRGPAPPGLRSRGESPRRPSGPLRFGWTLRSARRLADRHGRRNARGLAAPVRGARGGRRPPAGHSGARRPDGNPGDARGDGRSRAVAEHPILGGARLAGCRGRGR